LSGKVNAALRPLVNSQTVTANGSHFCELGDFALKTAAGNLPRF